MNDYYEILGVNPGASQIEIKKAYFKMIRKYSPESDPEQFQKIREAYEQLGKAQNLSEGPSFPAVHDPWAAKMLKQMEQYRRIGDMEACRDTCEEARHIFPEEIQFLYWLVIAQRQCGNTGKAVKNAEQLVGKEPKNMWFQKELALSYMARGFTQKAYYACENAYELGCRDIDFTLMYAVECAEYGQYDRGIQILFEVVRQEKQWSKEEMPELTDAYMGLLKMNKDAEGIYLQEIMERLGQMLEKYSIYVVEYVPEIARMLAYTCVMEGNREADYQRAEYLYDIMRKICHTEEEKELIDEAAKEFHYQRLANDPRIGATLKRGYEAYYDLAELDESLMKFALTDTQLCMVEERQEILKQAEIIRQEYPDYYMKLESFIQKLKSEKNLVYLKDSLQKTYCRMEPNFGGGYYYELYPQEKRKMQGVLLHDGLEEDTYVRSTKKIGRNEPCPCGSGKKYKHCCMNK